MDGHFLYLIIPFWYALVAYQPRLVEPWLVFWRDAVKPKYLWRDQTSLICRRSVIIIIIIIIIMIINIFITQMRISNAYMYKWAYQKGTMRYLPYPNSEQNLTSSWDIWPVTGYLRISGQYSWLSDWLIVNLGTVTKENCFIFHMLAYKLFICAGPIAHYGHFSILAMSLIMTDYLLRRQRTLS